jgi:hypothetical protein
MLATIDTPMIRAVVAASLLLAMATLMTVVVNSARAAGALAVGDCGAFGEAFDFRAIRDAEASALSKCRGDNCKLATTIRRGCAAYAVDFNNPCGARGWGRGPRLGVTQNAALQACYRAGGKECVIRTFFCDAKG